ncbi:MAG: FAD-binding oxidoreductase [Gemmatimonadaceae bacterium]
MTEKIVIVGAGFGGVSAAYYLAARHGVSNVVLIDERDPLTLTSDKGTQGYRNWWPGPDDTMLRFVSRSIDLMEQAASETNNLFRLNRRGYLFATATESGVDDLRTTAARVSSFGMGAVREHIAQSTYAAAPAEGYTDQPDGADLLLDDAAHAAFPFLTTRTRAALHVRRAGWMNAPAMGSWMLRQAIGAGLTFVRDRVTAIDSLGGRVRGVVLASGQRIETNRVVLAAGPMLHDVSRMLGIELPLHHELHAKVTFADTQHIIPRWAPFTIWNDPVTLGEQPFPAGVHVRPVDGPHGNELFAIWTYHTEQCTPSWPPPFESNYGRNCIHGLAAMVPGMSVYANSNEYGFTDGGYYCKASDNRPLIGPLPVDGAYVVGALSGTGIMSSHAAGELLALHMTEKNLPEYANAFLPSRFDDPAYTAIVEGWGRLTGQL